MEEVRTAASSPGGVSWRGDLQVVGVTPSHQTPRLGPPEAIAAAAQPIARAPGTGRETAALFFLTIGSILLPIVGWVIGLLLLWASPRWTARQKYLGTLVPPGGWLFFAWVGLAGTGTSCVSSETV